MAKTTSFVLLAFGLLILSVLLVNAISVPDPGEGVCYGSQTTSGEFISREQGGCCIGTVECCQYEYFKNMPMCLNSAHPSCTDVSCCEGLDCCQYEEYENSPLCVTNPPSCSGLECCQYEDYANSPLCTCSGKECCQYNEYKNSKVCSCSGLDCCQYEEYENTPLCVTNPPSCSGLECCQYEEYENSPVCSCSDLDCCQYEEYQNTPLCVVPPTKEECTSPPPQCPVGSNAFGVSAPMLLNPGIASGSKCRGACGPDCPDTCAKVKDQTICMADAKGECFYVCTYYNVLSCGVHDGCQTHDDCYDACAAKGEKSMCLGFIGIGLCHCSCDLGCYFSYGPGKCWDWMNGRGPFDYSQLYSSPPLISGKLKACPPP